MISIEDLETPLGTLRLRTRNGKLCELVFVDEPASNQSTSPAAAALRAYFQGDPNALDQVELELEGTSFQQRVWKRARAIPFGGKTTYGALAAELSSAPRAVGRALGSNRVALVIPCHRVVGADGDLRGYAFGLERKRALLTHEQKCSIPKGIDMSVG